MKTIVELSFRFSRLSQWSIWPFLVEWPLDALESQNKNKHIAHYERKRMILGCMGFALLTPTTKN